MAIHMLAPCGRRVLQEHDLARARGPSLHLDLTFYVVVIDARGEELAASDHSSLASCQSG